MMSRKIVVITGANRGLGKALCDYYLDQQNTVVVSLSRRQSEDQAALSETGDFHFLQTDLAQEIDDKNLKALERIVLPEDKIIFISNASVISPINQIGKLNANELNTLLNVNARSVVVICNYLLRTYGGYEIDFVNISSGAAHRPLAHWSLYCSTKAFNHMFFEALKLENQREGIRVFQVDPGVMDTGMQAEIRESTAPDVESFRALKTEGTIVSAETAAMKVLDTIQ